jgi:ribosomal protein S18 acetylase RimI-like enzyme
VTAIQPGASVRSDAEQSGDNKIQISYATLEDVESLVALHYMCFSKKDHIAIRFGKPFIVSTYRWFLTSPETFVLIAKQGESLVGFASASERPYDAPMLRAGWREALIGLLFHPWLAFHPELVTRLLRLLFRQNKDIHVSDQDAQLAFIGVDSNFQGMGIGKTLLIAAIRACRERGMSALSAGVKRQNVRSLAMFTDAGFVEVPELGTKRFAYLRTNLDQHDPSSFVPRILPIDH